MVGQGAGGRWPQQGAWWPTIGGRWSQIGGSVPTIGEGGVL